jgi:hypothetical protein
MLNRLFGRGPKGLNDLSQDELMKERTKLELEERKTLKKLEALEKDKNRLFEEAKRSGSKAVMQVKARQIRDIDHRIKEQQSNIRRLGKMLQLVNVQLLQMEKGQLLGSDSPFAKLITETSSADLSAWLDGNLAEGSLVEHKVDEILSSFRDADELRGDVTGDPELDAIMQQIEEAQAIDAMSAEMMLDESDAADASYAQ